jgi:hypothetical protein
MVLYTDQQSGDGSEALKTVITRSKEYNRSMKPMIERIINLMLIVCLLVPIAVVKAQGDTQNPDALSRARQHLSQLTPEEKVGQLLIVSFTGTDVGDQSQIYDLITHHHIGGVILDAEINNFIGPVDTVEKCCPK